MMIETSGCGPSLLTERPLAPGAAAYVSHAPRRLHIILNSRRRSVVPPSEPAVRISKSCAAARPVHRVRRGEGQAFDAACSLSLSVP